MEHADFLQPILVLLFAGILGIAMVQRFKLSPILGYFLAGIIIGPFGLKMVGNTSTIQTIAEIGVHFCYLISGFIFPSKNCGNPDVTFSGWGRSRLL